MVCAVVLLSDASESCAASAEDRSDEIIASCLASRFALYDAIEMHIAINITSRDSHVNLLWNIWNI